MPGFTVTIRQTGKPVWINRRLYTIAVRVVDMVVPGMPDIQSGKTQECAGIGAGNALGITATERRNGSSACTNPKHSQTADDSKTARDSGPGKPPKIFWNAGRPRPLRPLQNPGSAATRRLASRRSCGLSGPHWLARACGRSDLDQELTAISRDAHRRHGLALPPWPVRSPNPPLGAPSRHGWRRRPRRSQVYRTRRRSESDVADIGDSW